MIGVLTVVIPALSTPDLVVIKYDSKLLFCVLLLVVVENGSDNNEAEDDDNGDVKDDQYVLYFWRDVNLFTCLSFRFVTILAFWKKPALKGCAI